MSRGKPVRAEEACGGCGYDIALLLGPAVCPECGYDVAAARRSYLTQEDDHWVSRLRRSLRLLRAILIVDLVFLIAVPAQALLASHGVVLLPGVLSWLILVGAVLSILLVHIVVYRTARVTRGTDSDTRIARGIRLNAIALLFLALVATALDLSVFVPGSIGQLWFQAWPPIRIVFYLLPSLLVAHRVRLFALFAAHLSRRVPAWTPVRRVRRGARVWPSVLLILAAFPVLTSLVELFVIGVPSYASNAYLLPGVSVADVMYTLNTIGSFLGLYWTYRIASQLSRALVPSRTAPGSG
ncbi:MAG: hypothetical protein AAGG07_06840 [Planctomycetota bacterium]